MKLIHSYIRFVLVACLFLPLARGLGDIEVKYISSGDKYGFHPPEIKSGFLESRLMIYCFSGANKPLSHFFLPLVFNLDIANDDYELYEGGNAEDVASHYDDRNSIFSIGFFWNRRKQKVLLSPFNQICIGIDSTQPYQVQLNYSPLVFWKLLLLLIGLFVFAISAEFRKDSLSELYELLFFIITPLLFIFTPYMLLVHFLVHLVCPYEYRASVRYAIVISGWAVGIYFWELTFELNSVSFITDVIWNAIRVGSIFLIIMNFLKLDR